MYIYYRKFAKEYTKIFYSIYLDKIRKVTKIHPIYSDFLKKIPLKVTKRLKNIAIF